MNANGDSSEVLSAIPEQVTHPHIISVSLFVILTLIYYVFMENTFNF
jgi:hypothetical protein